MLYQKRVAISCLPVMCETGYCRASVITGLNYLTRLLDLNAVAVCTPHNIQQLWNLIPRMPCSTFMRLHMSSQASSAGDCWWARHYLCLIPVLSFHSYDTNFDIYVSLLISWYKLFKETPSFLAMFLIHTLKSTRMYVFKKCAKRIPSLRNINCSLITKIKAVVNTMKSELLTVSIISMHIKQF